MQKANKKQRGGLGWLIIPTLFLAGFFISVPAVFADNDPAWTAISPLSSDAPDLAFGSCVVDGKIYLLAGSQGGTNECNQVERYDPSTDSWSELPPLSENRWGLTAATIDGQIIIIAGGSPIPSGSTVTEAYDPYTGSTTRKAEMPNPGWGVASAVANGKLYVFGGYNWQNAGENYNREYDPVTDTWTLKKPMPTPRSWFSAETINGKIYAVGGWDKYDQVDLATLEVYDPATDTWETKTPMPIGLKSSLVTVFDNKLYVIGGWQYEQENSVYFDTVFIYDPAADAWTTGPSLPSTVYMGAAETIGENIFVFGAGAAYRSGPTPTPAIRNPVIIVPGIMGSYLKQISWPFDKEIWLNLAGYLVSKDDNDLLKLKMDSFGSSIEDLYVDEAIDKVITEDFYKGLIKELEDSGYEINKDLFVFPYDWRYDLDCLAGVNQCVDSGVDSLNKMITRVKNRTGVEKVDLMTHSMGGLITKAYLDHFGNDSVGKFITVATPHFGSPKAAKILLYGDNLGICLLGRCFLNEKNVEEISQNIPSIYQLLPSRKLFDYYDGYINDYDDKNNDGVIGDLNYGQTMNFLGSIGKNQYLLSKAMLFHDKVDDSEVDNSYSISGCGLPTIGKVYVLNKEKNGKYEYALSYVSGDKTVPLESGENFGQKRYLAYKSEHGTISSDNGVKQLIVAILNGKEEEFDFSQHRNVGPTTSYCRFSGKEISYHSPISMEVYDEYGNFVGRNADGDIKINIPGAQYDEIEENKFVFLPDGGSYTIKGLATADGSFNARIQKIEDGEYTQESYFNEIPLIGSTTNTEITIGDQQEEYKMKIDNDNDGVFEQEKSPNAVLTGEEINDLTKPKTMASIIGQAGNNDYYISDISVELSAQDDSSGLLKTEYSVDNGQTWNKYEGEFLLDKNGTTTILYSSTDRAGNREENKEMRIRMDKEAPEIALLVPEEGQELKHNEILEIEYLVDDEFSGISTATEEIYFDGQRTDKKSLDLFNYSIGQRSLKIKISDLAGNYSEKEVNFYIVAGIDSAISDINRLYLAREIKNTKAKNDLIGNLEWIKDYIEKNAKKEIKREKVEEKIMKKCVAKKGEAWCLEKLDKIFQRIDYRLSMAQKKIVELKYELILKRAGTYEKIGQISEIGYNIIKENIKYLLRKL